MIAVQQAQPRPELKPHVPVTMLRAQEAAWMRFKWFVEELARTEFGDDGLKVFYKTIGAYHELRDAHVDKRERRKTQSKDPALERWTKQLADFHTRFYGVDEGKWVGSGEKRIWKASRRFQGCSEEVVRYMRTYQSLWNRWWPHTPGGQKSKRKANARQAKRPTVKAAKLMANKTEAGKARRKVGKKKARQAAKVARGAAEQALYDSWATEDAIEEALRDV